MPSPINACEVAGAQTRFPPNNFDIRRSTSTVKFQPDFNTMASSNLVLPGDAIGSIDAHNAGDGTHIHQDRIFASITGASTVNPSSTNTTSSPTATTTRTTGPLLPQVGTVVLGTITRIAPGQAHVAIQALGATGAARPRDHLPAVIRQHDIRATETDRLRVSDAFRVGDVVRAVVISLGDERTYYLSSARNDLGVVMAVSEAGRRMVPVSWCEFADLETGHREPRKVAKPV